MKILIVGAGLTGCICAALLKGEHQITIIEKAQSIGGLCYDGLINGVLCQHFGPHVIHTDNKMVFDFMSKYGEIDTSKRLKVKGITSKGLIPIPFNNISEKITGELSDIEIFNLIFKNYSEKQWGMEIDKIPESILKRTKLKRDTDNDEYKEEKYQGVPVKGYTVMMQKMIEGVEVLLNTDYRFYDNKNYDVIIYTGSIDEYYNYEYGKLEYRSLVYKHIFDLENNQYMQVNNCTEDHAYIRYYNNKQFYNINKMNVCSYEIPLMYNGKNIRCYPIATENNINMFNEYYKKRPENVVFLGRLGTYKYMDMDDVVLQAMEAVSGI